MLSILSECMTTIASKILQIKISILQLFKLLRENSFIVDVRVKLEYTNIYNIRVKVNLGLQLLKFKLIIV